MYLGATRSATLIPSPSRPPALSFIKTIAHKINTISFNFIRAPPHRRSHAQFCCFSRNTLIPIFFHCIPFYLFIYICAHFNALNHRPRGARKRAQVFCASSSIAIGFVWCFLKCPRLVSAAECANVRHIRIRAPRAPNNKCSDHRNYIRLCRERAFRNA